LIDADRQGAPTLMLFSVVDDRSGVAYQEYRCVYGEDAETALRFLFNAMALKVSAEQSESDAFQGIPDTIHLDNGPVAKSAVFKRVMVDDAHDLHPKTLVALKRLIELVTEGGGQLSIVLIGHPKLKNDLRRPKMEEIGDRTTVFEFGGLRDRQRDYIDWVLKASLDEHVAPDDVVTDEAATILAAKLKTPLQIGQHLVRAFEAGFEIGAKPIDTTVVEAILSRQLNDLEPQLTRNGYDIRSLVEQFDAKPSEIRQLLRGDLDPGRSRELMDEMRAAGLPT
jgi:hypothetical protein